MSNIIIDTLHMKDVENNEYIIYPRTHIKAVVNENGENIEEIVADLVKENIGEVTEDTFATKEELTNYLPLTGGKINGDITANSYYFYSNITSSSGVCGQISGNSSFIKLDTYPPNGSGRTLQIFNQNGRENIEEALQLLDNVNLQSYSILHTGNSAKVVTTDTDPGAGSATTYAEGTVICVYE